MQAFRIVRPYHCFSVFSKLHVYYLCTFAFTLSLFHNAVVIRWYYVRDDVDDVVT